MPLREDVRHHYGRTWRKEIRPRILARAMVEHHDPDHQRTYAVARCECVGQCGTEHKGGRCPELDRHEALNFNGAGRAKRKRIRADASCMVILTVAHLDQEPENMSDENLLALCQQCHNRLDAPYRPGHSRTTKYRRLVAGRRAGGQLDLPFVVASDPSTPE